MSEYFNAAAFRNKLNFETVNILVGAELNSIHVHKNLLCSASQFFEKAFSGPWVEGQTRSIHLEEDKLEVVQIFVDWLYHDKFDMTIKEDAPILPVIESVVRLLIDLYGFAESKLCERFKNAIMDNIQSSCLRHDYPFDHLEVEMIFDHTTAEDDPLQTFCVASIDYLLRHRDREDYGETYHQTHLTAESASLIFEACPSAMRRYLSFLSERCEHNIEQRFFGYESFSVCEFHSHEFTDSCEY